jgi:hypothetical protein
MEVALVSVGTVVMKPLLSMLYKADQGCAASGGRHKIRDERHRGYMEALPDTN